MMRVLVPGHFYELDCLDSTANAKEQLQFVQRHRHNPDLPDHPGTTNQEVIRVLIDRVNFLNAQMPHDVNPKIIHHLRMALVLHEARALERKVEEGKLNPEVLPLWVDGHIKVL